MRTLAALFFCLLLVACSGPSKDTKDGPIPQARPAADPATVLVDAAKDGDSEAGRIDEALKATNEAADAIEKESDTINRGTTSTDIQKASDSITRWAAIIKSQQEKIATSLEDIRQALSKMPQIAKEVVRLQEKIAKLEAAQDTARNESLKKLYGYLVWFWVIGFLMLVGGGFATIYAKRIGGGLIGMGLLTIGFASAAHFYLQQIAIVGLVAVIVGFLVVIGIVVWLIADSRKHEQATAENVKLIESVKKDLPPEKKDEIFGDKGLATKVQSPSTQKIVAKVRKTIAKQEPPHDAVP